MFTSGAIDPDASKKKKTTLGSRETMREGSFVRVLHHIDTEQQMDCIRGKKPRE